MKLSLSYRDGSNYKCAWDVEISDEQYAKAKEHFFEDEDGHCVEIEDLGLTMNDIPLIQQYGKNSDDHNIVNVEEIK